MNTEQLEQQTVEAITAWAKDRTVWLIGTDDGEEWGSPGEKQKIGSYKYYRLAPGPMPIPIERLRELCGGREPHRTDWTTDMLPEGYRPLWNGENYELGDEFHFDAKTWMEFTRVHVGGTASPSSWSWRTRRPAPPLESARYTVEEIAEWYISVGLIPGLVDAFRRSINDPSKGIAAVVARKGAK